MGGSSLAPEVFRRSWSGHRMTLHVLDSTHPEVVKAATEAIDLDKTLFVISSKSGGTIETLSQFKYFHELQSDGAHYAAVTDPGSGLAELGRRHGFRRVFENDPDIGGRYSALSLFGVVPGLLAGVDVPGLLTSANAMAERLRTAPAANPAARLAATMAAGVRNGRDKLTIVVPDEFAVFGLWVEQLVAESTGKDGTGILPVVGEPLGNPDAYGDDRVFVGLGDVAGLDALARAGHPVVVLPFGGEFAEIGGQVLQWELATALAGALLDIQPFDQPDVAAAKAATAEVLAGGPPDLPTTSLDEVLAQVQPGDYLAIQAFIDPGSPAVAGLEAARGALRDRLKVATTFGLGPRFLHSTGQLHKGGPPTGVFLQVVTDTDTDVPIPGEGYGFGTLVRAQADGDMVTLADRKRRAGRVPIDELLSVTS
jgi:transaldolase / glucose-6-phosphate isomerase